MATNKFIVKDKSHGKYAKKLFGVKCILTNFQPTLHFPYPLKTSENPRFSDIFTRYRRETVENGLSQVLVKLLRLMLSYLRCVFSSFTKSLHSFVIISILIRYVCNELKSSRLACEAWFLKRVSISWIFKKKKPSTQAMLNKNGNKSKTTIQFGNTSLHTTLLRPIVKNLCRSKDIINLFQLVINLSLQT